MLADLTVALRVTQCPLGVSLQPLHVAADDRPDLGILRSQFDRRVDHQASHPALAGRQVLDQAVEVPAQLRQSRAGLLQRPQLLRHDQLRVPLERPQEQAALAAGEGIVEAARLHTRGLDQVVHGRVTVAALPEFAHRAIDHLIWVESPRPGHATEDNVTTAQEQAAAPAAVLAGYVLSLAAAMSAPATPSRDVRLVHWL